MMLTYIY